MPLAVVMMGLIFKGLTFLVMLGVSTTVVVLELVGSLGSDLI